MPTPHKVILNQFRPAFGLSSGSPFCLKVETFLRMSEIDYEIEIQDMPQKTPKGKLPTIEYQGQVIPDSSDILKFLAREFPGAQKLMKLKKADEARAHAMRRMLEEHFYFCLVFFRWIPAQNWEITRKAFFGFLPPPLRLVVPGLAQKKVKGQLHEQGLGRHSAEEIAKRGLEDLKALEALSGKSGFILGNSKPSFVDATAFGMLASLYYSPIESPLKDWLLKNKRFLGYLKKMRGLYFPEIDEI